MAVSRDNTARARFIDPQVLARLDNLDLVARTVVDGFISGLHRSVYLGVSTDFAEHRAYVPGDDVRHVDWRVYARTDRLYLRTFEVETNADVMLALDVSGSMGYASAPADAPANAKPRVSKLDYGRFVAGSLAHLAGRQRDRVGFVSFAAQPLAFVPPSARHRDTVLHALDNAAAGGVGDFAGALSRIGERLRRRGIVVLISDLYVEPAAAGRALEELRARGHDVIVFQILDPRERDLSALEDEVLEDLETGERLPLIPASERAGYRRLLADHVAALARECGKRRMDHALFDTSMPLDHLLATYLTSRHRAARTR